MKQIYTVMFVCILLCFPLSTVTSHNLENNPANSATEDDIELYIWGGPYLLLNKDNTNDTPIGFFVRVVNNGDDWISGNYSYHIPYLNPHWYFNISFYVAPHQEYRFHQAFKYSFTFFVVKLTVENKTLIRSGFMIMGFTVFLTSIEIEHSEKSSKIEI